MNASPDDAAELTRIAATIRASTLKVDKYREGISYVGYIAELAALHVTIAAHARDTVEHQRAYTEAVKVFKAARIFATRHSLPHPNEILLGLGINPY